MGLVFVPLSTLTFATLDPSLRTDATAFFSLMRNIGSSIGISVVESLLARNTQINHASLARHIDPFNKLLLWPKISAAFPLDTVGGIAAANSEVTRQAAMIAYIDDFKLLMIMAIVSIPFVVLMRRPRPTGASHS
jgi:DHA2 family multidrug resistance protein